MHKCTHIQRHKFARVQTTNKRNVLHNDVATAGTLPLSLTH